METYADFAFALKIKETGNATLSRQYYNFMVSELNVDLERVVDWCGFPIPEIPTGRYLSARLLGNGAETYRQTADIVNINISHRWAIP